nr:hypothetical protein [Bacilli bacterium]
SIIALVMGINYLSRRDKCNVIRSEVVEVNEKEYTDGTKEMDFTIESHYVGPDYLYAEGRTFFFTNQNTKLTIEARNFSLTFESLDVYFHLSNDDTTFIYEFGVGSEILDKWYGQSVSLNEYNVKLSNYNVRLLSGSDYKKGLNFCIWAGFVPFFVYSLVQLSNGLKTYTNKGYKELTVYQEVILWLYLWPIMLFKGETFYSAKGKSKIKVYTNNNNPYMNKPVIPPHVTPTTPPSVKKKDEEEYDSDIFHDDVL